MKTITKHYDKLTPAERLPLLINASARGDRLEFDRLSRTAPKIIVTYANHADLARRLERIANGYLLRQLELVVQFLELVGKDTPKQIPDCARYLAYWIATNADSWEHFCSDLGIEHDAPIHDLPGFGRVRTYLSICRSMAPTFDQAWKYLRDFNPDASPPPTVDEIVQEAHAHLNRIHFDS